MPRREIEDYGRGEAAKQICDILADWCAVNPIDVVMFAMDRQMDRRIVLAAETLMGAGYTVRVFAPADGAPQTEPAWIERVKGDGAGLHGSGLSLYRFVRDRLPRMRGVLRWVTWHLERKPARVFETLFADPISRAPARIYVANDLPMLPVAIAAQARHGGRVLYDSHELYSEQGFSRHERRVWRSLEASLIARADAVITVNQSIGEELTRRYAIAPPTIVHNADRFRPAGSVAARERDLRARGLRAALGIPPGAALFLYQGGLVPGRNLETLVEAFREMNGRRAVLVMLGDGPLKPMLQQRVERLGLEKQVKFHPAVPQDQLLDLTAQADFGIIPYRATCLNNALCTPNKLFEFIMARVPMFATDLREVRSVIARYNIGLLGDTSSARIFAQGLRKTLEVAPAFEREWRAGLDVAARELCWEREGEKYLAVVRGLVPQETRA